MQAQADTLNQLFAVEAYDPELGLFQIHPGYIGYGFLCQPIPGYDQTTADKLNVLLNQAYPAGTVVQIALYASPDLELPLHAFQRMRSNTQDEVLRHMARERAAYLRVHADQPVDNVSGLKIHNTQVIITVKLPTSTFIPGADTMRKATELRAAGAQTLKTIGVPAQELTPELYTRVMSTILNQGKLASWRGETKPWYSDQHLICHQILDTTTQVDIDDRGLTIGDSRVRVLHVKKYPEVVDFGMSLRYLGDMMSGARGIRDTVLMTLNIHYPDEQTARQKLETDRLWANRNASGPMARLVPEYALRKASHDVMSGALRDGDRVVQAYFGIAVFTRNEETSIAAAANVRTYFRELGFQLLEDHFIVGPLFMNLLPFATDVQARGSLMRYRTFATRHVVAFAPVLSSWRGTGTPLLTLLSRDGQLMSVSPFDAPEAAHGVITGMTGTGKSFFAQDLIANARATNVVVRCIDIGRSYANLCEILGGQFIEFSDESTICLNPFTHVRNFNQQADALVNLVHAMAAPSEPLSSVQLAELRRVLAETFADKQTEMTIDDLAAALRQGEDPRVRDVGTQLYAFTSAGEYGRFFHGRNNLDMNNPFVVLELEALKGRKQLQRVVLMQIMHGIYQEAFLGDRSKSYLTVIDEAWQLLNESDRDGAEIGAFIEFMWRTGRKVGLAVLAISQDLSSFANSRAGQAILANSPNTYLLKQKPDSIMKAKKEGHLAIGEYGFHMLATVHSLRGEYSEILVACEGAIGVGRLVVSQFQNLLYSTTPRDVARLRQLRATGLSIEAAVQTLVAERRDARAVAA